MTERDVSATPVKEVQDVDAMSITDDLVTREQEKFDPFKLPHPHSTSPLVQDHAQ